MEQRTIELIRVCKGQIKDEEASTIDLIILYASEKTGINWFQFEHKEAIFTILYTAFIDYVFSQNQINVSSQLERELLNYFAEVRYQLFKINSNETPYTATIKGLISFLSEITIKNQYGFINGFKEEDFNYDIKFTQTIKQLKEEIK
jgi:hypothetical protein